MGGVVAVTMSSNSRPAGTVFATGGCTSHRERLVGRWAPQLLEAIVAMPASAKGHLCFLVTEYGKPFSDAGFGNWFRDKCDDAGLPQCSANGLRKATMRRMSELGMSNQSMKSVSGHSTDQ